jgi:hypothetical protein
MANELHDNGLGNPSARLHKMKKYFTRKMQPSGSVSVVHRIWYI